MNKSNIYIRNFNYNRGCYFCRDKGHIKYACPLWNEMKLRDFQRRKREDFESKYKFKEENKNINSNIKKIATFRLIQGNNNSSKERKNMKINKFKEYIYNEIVNKNIKVNELKENFYNGINNVIEETKRKYEIILHNEINKINKEIYNNKSVNDTMINIKGNKYLRNDKIKKISCQNNNGKIFYIINNKINKKMNNLNIDKSMVNKKEYVEEYKIENFNNDKDENKNKKQRYKERENNKIEITNKIFNNNNSSANSNILKIQGNKQNNDNIKGNTEDNYNKYNIFGNINNKLNNTYNNKMKNKSKKLNKINKGNKLENEEEEDE